AGGLLAGMWSFPEAPLDGGPGEGGARVAGRAAAGDGAASRAVVEAALRAATGAGAEPTGDDARVLGAVGHRFTHLAATYVPVLLRGRAVEGPDRRWIDIATPAGVALPAAQRRIAARAHGALHARSNGRAAPRENDART
ncbi:MAG TPA: NUDIX domain-containing protein, partial [Longimicrobiales bacterium]|nr:NUDIX domain-containing protein [Longimicrobiales bacterium]